MARYFFLAIIALINLESISSLVFEEHKYNSGLMFVDRGKTRVSYDTHKMVYHVDISEYKAITAVVENSMKIITNHSRTISNQFQTLLDGMKDDESYIEAYQEKYNNKRRDKRHLQFIGSFMNWAKNYDEAIANIQNVETRWHPIDDQTIIIKAMLNTTNIALKDFEENVKKLENKDDTQKKNMSAIDAKIQKEKQVENTITFLKLLIQDHKLQSTQILGLLEKSNHKFITNLVSFDDLYTDLMYIQYSLEDNQRLPINIKNQDDPIHILKFSTIKSSLYGNKLLIEINLPIIERQRYSLYEIIPIPINDNDRTLIITSTLRYVLINDIKEEYIPIKNDEYLESKINLAAERIIIPSTISYTDHSKTCEINIWSGAEAETILKSCEIMIIPSKTYFIPINMDDLYYISNPTKVKVAENCYGETTKNHVLHGSGYLHLSDDCRVSTDQFQLIKRTHQKMNIGIIKPVNTSAVITNLKNLAEKLSTTNNILTNIIARLAKSNVQMLIDDPIENFNDLALESTELIETAYYDDKFKHANAEYYTDLIDFFFILIFAMILACFIIFLAIKWILTT